MREERKMCGLPITLRDIIEEESQGCEDVKGCLQRRRELLEKLQQLEKRIKDALAFLEPAGDNVFNAGVVHALRKIWGVDEPSELISSEVKKKVRLLVMDGLCTDGAHYKQWYLEKVGKLIGIPIEEEFERLKKERREWERGMPP